MKTANDYIAPDALIIDSTYGKGLRIYKNAVLSKSTIGLNVSIGDDTTVERCIIGSFCALNRRSYINDSQFGDYSYFGINTTINFSKIGRFCSIARNVDIGGFDHDYYKTTTMPMFRLRQMLEGKKPEVTHHELCEIGNDVWIAAGAQVLHKVKVGDGAIVGGGAVVTKDVPPYAIVAGVPARIIKYRFQQNVIDELLSIQWWNWPEQILKNNFELLIQHDVSDEVLSKLHEINSTVLEQNSK